MIALPSQDHEIAHVADSILAWFPNPSLTFTSAHLEIWALDGADRPSETSGPGASRELGGGVADVQVPLPSAPGRWLLSIRANWQTDCLEGDGYVDVLLVTTEVGS